MYKVTNAIPKMTCLVNIEGVGYSALRKYEKNPDIKESITLLYSVNNTYYCIFRD